MSGFPQASVLTVLTNLSEAFTSRNELKKVLKQNELASQWNRRVLEITPFLS